MCGAFVRILGRLQAASRTSTVSGAYRVIYVARRADAVYVLHAFQKKTQATSRRDIDTAKRRFAQLSGGGK
jgi:phage-related protein